MGMLEVIGTIDLNQFWPAGGESDADTTHVSISEIHYQQKQTDVFKGAYIRGRDGKKEVIRNGAVTVRWQGIDAPELHYTPMVPKRLQAVPSHSFRQHYGEASTAALYGYLKDSAGKKAQIACRVTTEVDHPNDVFDTYGRLIGDVLVKVGSNEVNLNRWQVEQGWAFPTFYASMSEEEITTLASAAATAREKHLGIWDGFTQQLTFDDSLVFTKHIQGQKVADSGAVLLPKLFRRVATEYVTEGRLNDFAGYLKSPQQPDRLYLTHEFLEQGPSASVQHDLYEFVKGSRVTFAPADLVFVEAPSTLFDAQGRKVRSWSQK